MPRRSASDVIEPSAPNPSEVRAGATISPDMVNVFQQAVSPGASRGLHLAPVGGRPSGDAIALSLLAWVRNVSYDKELWLDLNVLDTDGKPLHAEIVSLTFQEPAEGGGDFFAAGAAIPAPKPAKAGPRSLTFRLYGFMQGQLYTDGILHTHRLEPAAATAPPETAGATDTAPAAEPAAPKATRSRAPKATSAASPKPVTPRKPRTPKA